MIDINPFCDSDIRNGLQFLSGVNLLMIGISLVVDALAIVEIVEFSNTWDPSSLYIPVIAGIGLLCSDIFVNLLVGFCGWVLYSSVTQKADGKINKLFYPTLLLFIVELAIVICYLVCIPSSPFFYYFSSLTLLYKAFLFWPLKRFINDHSHPRQWRPQPQLNERTRLLPSVT